MLLKVLIAVAISSSIAIAAEAPKAEDKKSEPQPLQKAGDNFIGGFFGASKPAEADVNTPVRLGFGAEFTHAYNDKIASGAFISRDNGPIVAESNIDFGITRVGAQARFSPTIDSFLDLRAGIGLLDAQTTIDNVTISADGEAYFIGAGFGFVFPIMPKIYLAPSLHYSNFFENSDVDQFTVVDAMLAIRYQL